MVKLVFFLVALCVLTYSNVDAHKKCKDDFQKMKKKMNEMMESEDAMPCIKEHKLDEYKCTGGEDKDKDEEIHEAFVKYFKESSEKEQEGMMKCMKDLQEVVFSEVDMSDECKEKAENILSKMTEEKS